MPLSTRALLLAAALPSVMAKSYGPPTPAELKADEENWNMCKYTAYVWAVIVGIMLVYRWGLVLLRHIRRIANLSQGTASDNKQRYFSVPDETWAAIKRHYISAPLLKRRHNREFKLSAAINVGTLPGRAQTVFLLGYFIMNIVTCAMYIDWTDADTFIDGGCKRTGVLAVLNMIPLFILAGRNNPFIWLLGVSFDTFNLIHRWVGRIVVFEAVAHSAFWMAGKIYESGSEKGWAAIGASFTSSSFIYSGLTGTCAFIFLLLHSPSALRHAWYETFLHMHFLVVVLASAAVWFHLKTRPQRAFVIAAVICWILERSLRCYLILRRNVGKGGTTAEVEALPGEAVRITLHVAKPWKFRPGQHVYMYMPSVGLWTSHPFSICWSEDAASAHDSEKGAHLPMARQDILARTTTSMSLIVRRRTGFTDRMWKKAEAAPGGRFTASAFVEGPYGEQCLQSYGTVMLFAAGVGITHQVPHVRDLVAAYANGTAATRSVTLVWVIQSPEHLEWIRPWMTQILGMEKRRDILRILLFVTRPRSTKEIHSPSSSVQMFPGKPDVGALMSKEQERQVGAMAVSVCGTGSLSDDVRRATRERCEGTEIDVFEEAFSW